jgi:hypothetical protein
MLTTMSGSVSHRRLGGVPVCHVPSSVGWAELDGTVRAEEGSGFEHFAGDGKQAVGDRPENPAMTMAYLCPSAASSPPASPFGQAIDLAIGLAYLAVDEREAASDGHRDGRCGAHRPCGDGDGRGHGPLQRFGGGDAMDAVTLEQALDRGASVIS